MAYRVYMANAPLKIMSLFSISMAAIQVI
jgi:hypothetical protein